MPVPKSPLPTQRIIRAVFAVLSAFALMPVGSTAAPDIPANELPWFLKGETHSSNPPRQFAYTNRLIDSNDPYLLRHAHNPVNWYPWDAEALARARRENKPIFVADAIVRRFVKADGTVSTTTYEKELLLVYPKPIRFKPSFTPDALNVYEGTAKIVATFPARTLKARKELRGTLTAQACNNEVCLPPSKLPISAKAP